MMIDKKSLDSKNILKVFKSPGIIILFLFFSSFFFGIFNINPSEISDEKYIIYLFISNLILFGIFAFIYRKTLIKDAKEYFSNFGKNIETSFKYWLIGFGIMAISNLFITFVLKKSIAGNEDVVRSYITTMPILMILDVVILAPFLEELTFRKSIREAINNKWCYVLISGIIFGWMHIASYISSISDLVYLIPYSALGISFSLLYYKTDNIFSTIMMHAMHNGLAVLVYLLGALIWRNLLDFFL